MKPSSNTFEWLDEKTYQTDKSRGSLPSHLPKEGMIVIGAGLGRTGTESLQTALQILLNAPCYHMAEVMRHKEAILWVPNGSAPLDLDKIFNNRPDGIRYRACVDYPAAAYVPELMKMYPDAMVLLSNRKTAEEWAISSEATIWRATKLFLILNTVTLGLIPFFRNSTVMMITMVKKSLGFAPTLGNLTRTNLIAAYERHNAEIERLVPKERLLVYTVGEGWEPICKKLNLPIPSVPYPHKNQKENFSARIVHTIYRQALGGAKGLIVLALVVALAVVYFR